MEGGPRRGPDRFGTALTRHYAGDDTDSRILAEGVLAAFADISVDDFAQQAESFLRTTLHPTLGRPYLECAYAPMVELLGYLEESGFTTYIVSGGGRDFMRPVTAEIYGIPSERVIGSAISLAYVPDDQGGTIVRRAAADYLDELGREAGAHLEPHGPPAGARRRELERRHRDARLDPASFDGAAATARAPRRRRA